MAHGAIKKNGQKMSAKNGVPCRRCGTSEWNKWGGCINCQRKNMRNWAKGNRGKLRENFRQWAAKNHEYNIERRQKHHLENAEYERQKARQWRTDNIALARERDRQWTANNLDKAAAKARNRRTRKKGNGGKHTAAEFRILCEYYNNRCLRCGKTDIKLTADHVVPVASGGGGDISNIQPLCQSCNSSKGNRFIDYRNKPIVRRFVQGSLFE